ncbi:MAG: uncharacterized protein JWP40_1225 [Blastococcus sp.]|nr:uncharacterized protein [Blastococcus sp.]
MPLRQASGVGTDENRSILTLPAPPPDAVLSYGPPAGSVADVRSGGPAAARRPLLVIVHGGFWRPEFDRSHVQPMAVALADAGWSSIVPEYRRIPGDPDAAVADVHAAVHSLPGNPALAGHSDGRVVLVGHSAGGHLALLAAAGGGDQLGGVLALAPVADLRLSEALALDGDAVRAFLGGPAAERADLDPVRMPTPAGRIQLLHGLDDAVVPLSVSESYRARHPRAELARVGAGHYALIDPRSRVWPELLAALGALSS